MTQNVIQIIKLLLVDDDFGDRKLTQHILSRQGQNITFNVETAETLEQTKKAIAATDYDIVLLDLGLPDGNGLDSVVEIVSLAGSAAVLVLTGLDDDEVGVKVIRSGAQDYLVKGTALEYTLVRTIKYAIERKRSAESLFKAQKDLEQMNAQLLQASESANKLAEQAKQASETKSQFLANMSHEIRTPMNAIIGFGQILAEENLNSHQREYVDLIIESSKHLLDIVNDILDFSKIEAGRLKVEQIDCSLRQLVHTVKSLVQSVAEEKHLQFEVIISDNLPDAVQIDPFRLKQCLLNLLTNAIKFTETGSVKLNVCLIDNGSPQLKFDVIDTGVGIPPDKQEKIFDAFTQADQSTSRKYGGTGLGLAICKNLAHLMGGTITLQSCPGKGSTFSLYVPIQKTTGQTRFVPKHPQQQEADPIPLQKTLSGCVLIAEDSKPNQTLIRILLEKMGLQTVIVEDGKQAVEMACSRHFDLILMDIQMPVMNGYEATAEIKRRGISTPVIATTANVMEDDNIKCLQAGCDSYISKPIDRTKLQNMISEYLLLQPAGK